MRILITGAGGPSAVSVWKSLSKEHDIYMADMDPCAAGLYLVPENRRFLIPRGDSPVFIPQLVALCQQKKIEILISTVDAELSVIAEHRHQLETLGVIVPLSSLDALKTCRDKYALLSLCQKTGYTPTFALYSSELSLDEFPFPCFVKPRRGAGSVGAVVIHNQQALEQIPNDSSYLIQELLPGEEYSVDVYIHSDGRPIAAVPRLRMKVDSGIAVAAQTRIIPQLATMALEIAQLVGIKYVANIQFKADKQGQFKLLEINPRFPGTLPLTAAAGVDMPQLLINDVLGKPFDSTLLSYKEIMVVRYWTEHFLPISEWNALCQN